MANIGEPIRRHTVIPLENPVQAPEGPSRSVPETSPPSPERIPEDIPGPLVPA